MTRSPSVSERNSEIRFFGVLREDYAFHFYVAQFLIFGYGVYRFTSRSYAWLGVLPAHLFEYNHDFNIVKELWPFAVSKYVTFQFIYDYIPRPDEPGMRILQWILIISCLFGLLGILSRCSAMVAGAISLHFNGYLMASDGPFDGCTLLICSFLTLALVPSKTFYSWRRISVRNKRVDYHWPLLVIMLFIGAFYTSSGLLKVIEIGPHWPFLLRLDMLAEYQTNTSVFVSTKYVSPLVLSYLGSEVFSAISGFIVMFGEIGFILVLWFPRWRSILVFSMIAMHVMIHLSSSINFMGSSALLLICLDWNVLVRRLTILYTGDSYKNLVQTLRRFDRLGRVRLPRNDANMASRKSKLDRKSDGFAVRDENGELYYDLDAVQQVMARCPLLMPLAWILSMPLLIYPARLFFNKWIQADCKRHE